MPNGNELYYIQRDGGMIRSIEYDYTIFPEMQDDLEKQSRVAMTSYLLTIDERRAIMGYDQLKDNERHNVVIPSGLTTLEDLYIVEENYVDEDELGL